LFQAILELETIIPYHWIALCEVEEQEKKRMEFLRSS
jgi:hypothetical protein